MKQKEKLIKNWTESSSGYSSSILKELRSFKRQAWTDLILQNAGREGKLKILDVGTGPGFFAIIMSLQGHDVTAIDCTQAMLDEAQHNAELFGVHPQFLLSDTQSLDFPDDTFDLVISRNVVWTIMDAEKAFREWRRVLKSGGRMIAFDANWNLRLFDENKRKEYERDQEEYREKYTDIPFPVHSGDMDDFRRGMPLCAEIRPQWDLCALVRTGYKKILCETDLRKQIYDEREQLINRSSPMFMLIGEK